MKRLAVRISLLLAVLFALGVIAGPAFAQARFSDVSDGHWAERYIVKMDLRCVVDGYPDGTFKPDNSVSQVEAMKMAVHNAGLQSEVESADPLLYLPFTIPDWARKEAIVAVKKGFIVPEENRFVAGQPAPRAWVAQLMVRMIGKEAEAIAAAKGSLSFTDAASVPAWARGHVAVAVKYGLVEGYTDNSFKPLNAVTRAELSTLLTRAEKYVQVEGLISGSLSNVTSTSVTVADSNGKTKEYALVYPYHLYNQKGKIELASLQMYDRVSVFIEGNKAKYIEVLDEKAVTGTIRGEIVQVYPSEYRLTIKVGEQLKSVTLAETVSITLYGGLAGKLADLSRGNTVDIRLDEFNRGTVVQVLEGVSAATDEGIIHDIDLKLNLLTLKANDQFFPYRFDDNVVVNKDGLRQTGLNGLKVGDRVKISAQNGYVQTINLLEAGAELILNGTVAQINTSKRILTLKEKDGALKAYEVDANVKITISGKVVPGLSDIVDDDLVQIDVKNGKITAIEVKNREVENLVSGTLVAIDPSNLMIVLKDRDGDLKPFAINEVAECYIDDNRADLEDLQKDMKVEIQLVQGKVIYLECRNTILGTVEQIRDTRKVLVLREIDGELQTLIIDTKARVNIEDSKADIDDVKDGDLVEIFVRDGKVVEINVEKVLAYVVKDVVKSSDRLKVENDQKDSKNLYIRGNVELFIEGKDNPKIEDIKNGDLVRGTFLGNRLRKVEVVPVLSGKITSIDSFRNAVTVQLFGGAVQSTTFSDKSKIIISGRSYYNLSELTVGDRVQVRDDVGGGKFYYVMEKTSGQFYSVNDARDKIFIQKNPVEWDNYGLYENVYLHKSGTAISFRNLNVNDYVGLYILDKVVYEIEKQ